MNRFPEELRSLFDPVRVLGEGGYGVVYLAVERAGQVARAVKVVRARHGTENAARFEQEARVLGALQHRNIARIFAWGRWIDGYWLAMEYLEGETLREYLARHGPITSGQRVLEIAQQAGRALEFAHRRGVLHRDVKPDNLFLAGSDVKLLDFGLAKLQSEADSSVRTRQGILLGTPAYMAPERARGQEAGVATDVYALAVVTYEVLAGEPPFMGNPVEVLRAHLEAEVPPLPRHVPRAIDEAIRAGLAKAPADRPATPKDFVLGLRDAAREVVRQRRRGETPREVEAVADFRDEDLASRSGEADVPDPGAVLTELPPTVASSGELAREAVAAVAAEQKATDALDRSRLPTRSLRRRGLGGVSRALSRGLAAPGLLAPRLRPWILGAASLVALVGLGAWWAWRAAPAAPPELRSWVVGTHGVEFLWEVPDEAPRHFQVLPADDPAPLSLGAAHRPGRVEVGGLRPDQEYVVWAGAPGETPAALHRFRTGVDFRVEEVTLTLEEGGGVRAEVRATPAWRGAFRGQEVGAAEEGYREIRGLGFPPFDGEHPVLVAGGPGEDPRPRPEFVPALARAIRRSLTKVDPVDVSRRLLTIVEEGVMDSRQPLTAEDLLRLERELAGSPGMDLVLTLRRYLPGLVEDRALEADQRLELTRALAPLALVDATLHALGADQVLGPVGGLASSAALVFPELPSVTSYDKEHPPPAPYRSSWFEVERNNIHPRSMPPEIQAEYDAQIHKIYGDEPSLEEGVVRLELDEALDGRGELGLVMRATHPETAVFVVVNDRATIPVRWRASHGARRASGFLTAFMGTGSVADQLAPLTTRRFRLPSGVLRRGENEVRISCDNARARPDSWLPTLHGVFLRGDG